MTYEEAVSLKSFAHYCNCGAAHDPSRTGPNQHAHWCPQAEEYAAWWTAIHARRQAQPDECNAGRESRRHETTAKGRG